MSALPIFQRNRLFYWRRRIPLAVAAVTARTHFCRSLRTTDRSEARLRALRLSLAFEEAMQKQLRKIAAGIAPTRQELDRVLVELYERIIDECETWAATRPPYLEGRTYGSLEERDDDKEAQHDLRQNPAARELYWRNTMEVGDYGEAENYLASILKNRDLSLEPSSKEFKALAFNAMRVGIAAFRQFQRGMSPEGIDEGIGQLIARAHPPRFATHDRVAGASPSPDQPLPMFSKAFEDFRRAMSGSEWQDEQNADSATALKLWLDLEGDCRLDEMAARAWSFREKLAKVPRLHGRSVFKGLSAAEAIARADAIEQGVFDPKASSVLKRGAKVKRLRKKSQNKHLTFFTSFFNWKPIEALGLGKPFAGTLHTKRVLKREPKETRKFLTDQDIVGLFGTPVWRGCRSPSVRTKPGTIIIRDTLFWIPLVLAFQGMRMTEALQLWLEDIIEDDGLICIRIKRGPGRKLKSDAAERELPVHPMLRRIGFLDYVDTRRRNGDVRLFPDYVDRDTKFARSDAFSKIFGYYRRQVGRGDAWKDLHALRHSVVTCLIRKKVPEELVAYVLGHEGGCLRPRPLHMTTEVYFGGYERAQVEEAINAIEYPGLEKLLLPLFTTSRPHDASNIAAFVAPKNR